eukprot:TRINITY_DN33714_c0_g1_i1.p1 TRINITY_DN33714_c0_g1~~TRINITY_DN33714_c0_g1_i1.p1  ORF type:complete len:419 (-),score=50.50 TRINITY_DN33714_c0_g1_i1:859-2094(-)
MTWWFVLLCCAGIFSSSGTVFNVKDYGAKGDGKTDDTKAIRATTAALAKHGSGELLFPAPGTYLTAPFNLTSHTVMTITKTATVLGLAKPSLWPIIPPLPTYGTSRDNNAPFRYQALVYALNQTHIEITGGGTLDGGGAWWWSNRRNLKPGRGRLIELQGCNHLKVHDFTMQNSPFWNLHPVYSNDIHIYNMHIVAPHDSPNTDGIDPDSSTNILIENCYISTGDDHLAIKSGLNGPGLKYNLPTKNLTFRHNMLGHGHGISIGSETSGGIYDIFVHNNVMNGGGQAHHGLNIKTAPARGNHIANIEYLNNELNGVDGPALVIDMHYDNSPPAPHLPTVHNVTYKGVVGKKNKEAGRFECLQKSACSGLYFENVTLTDVKEKWKCQNVHQPWEVHHVKPDGLTDCLRGSGH